MTNPEPGAGATPALPPLKELPELPERAIPPALAADWAIRTYLPRIFGALEPFANLPPLGMALLGYYFMFHSAALASDAVLDAVAALGRAAQAHRSWRREMGRSNGEMAGAGFAAPPNLGFTIAAPFDFMSDTLRGMRGIMLDLRQRPDQLLAAQEHATRIMLRAAADGRAAGRLDTAFIPLHRGSDGFMSLRQFDQFYWPRFEELVLGLVDLGITPWVFYEGVWDQRLEYLTQFPAGKTVGLFQSSDIYKVKEIVGGTMCVVGGMPVSLLRTGSLAQIEEHTHEVCERVGAGGGFVMSTSVRELETCDPLRVRAWTDATRRYGQY